MEILNNSVFIGISLGIVLVLFFCLGVYATIKVGRHFIDNYVAKLTPEKLKLIEESTSKHTIEIDDEALWSRMMSQDDTQAYYDRYGRAYNEEVD